MVSRLSNRRTGGSGRALLALAVAIAGAASAPAGVMAFTPPVPRAHASPKGEAPAVDKALATAAGWQYESNVTLANIGFSAVTLGDVNGDGFSDFAVGSAGTNSVLVFFGAPGGPPASPSQTIAVAINSFGAVVAPAGDVNNDGYHDLLATAPYAGDGRAWVFYGSAGGLQTGSPWTYVHNDAGLAQAQFGGSAAGAGDVNGDGYDDIVIGVPFALDGAGAAYLFLGGPGGVAASPAWARTGGAGEAYGQSVAGAGDVNADGYADVVIGAPGVNLLWYGNNVYGAAFVHHGGAGGLSYYANSQLFGSQFGASHGAAVAGAGDVNGDGYADIAVGSPTYDFYSNADAGRALIYPGSSGGIVDAPLWEEYGIGANYRFGAVVATAGDVNGDGLADVAVGVPAYVGGSPNNGSAYVVKGSRAGYLFMGWYVFRYAGAGFGASVGTAGDVNDDGFSDLIVGSPLHGNGQTGEGLVEIFYGAGDPPPSSFSQSVTGGQDYPYYSWATTGVGDVNGDGYGDVAAGSPTHDVHEWDDGAVILYGGGPAGLSYALYWSGEHGGANFGYSVAAAGDVNGDGYGDIIVGAPTTGASGKAYVYHGGPYGPSWFADWSVSLGTAGAQFGISVASAGDVDGDGYGDVIVGARYDDNGQTDEGRAYVFHGSPSGLSTVPALVLEGDQDGGQFGNSVACAGDVNRDGYSDVIVGMESWDRIINQFLSLPDVGRAHVYLGGPSGLAAAPATTLQGSTSFQQFGHAVASAGDVDGDGHSDVIIGANLVNSTYTNEGLAAVFRGTASGVLTTAHWSRFGGQDYANLGSSVASAGDVNGDGLSDVIVGAVFADVSGRHDNGQALIFAGPLTGAAGATPIWSYAGQMDWENVGHAVGAAGDVNGDGFADVLTGGPGYTGGFVNEGRMLLFLGNGLYGPAEALSRVPQMRRADDSAPIALLGAANEPSPLRLKLRGGSAAGRDDVRLEWEFEPLAALLDGVGLGRGGWVDNGAGGPGNPPLLDSGALARPAGNAAHWRARVAGRSPFFPHSAWFSPAGNGRQETDLLVRDPVLSDVSDGPARPLGGPLPVSVAPNPFNPRTTIAFERARAGRVRIELFDLRGRALGVLLDEERPAGRVELPWDGRDGAGRDLASGSYFARVTAGGLMGTARLVLLR